MFRTERLVVEGWHSLDPQQLASFVVELLTPAVTRSLPTAWQGPYDEARAGRWVADRDAEGTVSVAMEGETPVGLLLLHEELLAGDVEVRIGYLLAEAAWGRGLGGELVRGFVRWCRAQSSIRALIGGVEADNAASIRILEHAGFERSASDPRDRRDLEYRLEL